MCFWNTLIYFALTRCELQVCGNAENFILFFFGSRKDIQLLNLQISEVLQ